jgi:hypothetical protein
MAGVLFLLLRAVLLQRFLPWQVSQIVCCLLMIWYWHQYDVAATLCGHKLIQNPLYP